jgi:ribosome-binding ATPase YchF (GTP1/OBG family)
MKKVHRRFDVAYSKSQFCIVCNVDESAVNSGNKHVDAVKQAIKDEDAEIIIITAAMEAEIAALDSYEDRQSFLKDIGLTEPGVNKLIKAAYKLLNL